MTNTFLYFICNRNQRSILSLSVTAEPFLLGVEMIMLVNYGRVFVQYVFGMLLILSTASPLFAQRDCLSEFVGTSNVRGTTGSFVLPSSLSFDVLNGKRATGDFAFLERSLTGQVEIEAFSAVAIVTQNGRCLAQLDAARTGGSLRLFEANFDANVFALVGSVEFDRDPGSVRLAPGKAKRFRGISATCGRPDRYSS